MKNLPMKVSAIGLILMVGALSASAAPKRAKLVDPLRAKCIPLVQAQICLPKGTGGFNCPETFEQEIDVCVKQNGKYP
ncbi:hypothetical protein SAMN05444161_3451 [Rhizobiales bacterium GAS191]|jgi:hypothetical protein|nr:hypothetical protein SAMN05519103_02619 [Rhizobiales bacterium GAS113]SED55043.1 hypothetical protein SAMN05444161_3451 [Rhizobiales bacterium GAS191]SEE79785.1 hypothetical protein SAMN05519104_7527 [Rhizobiales bacterium GAS188]